MSAPALRIKQSSPQAMPPITRSRARAMEAVATASSSRPGPLEDYDSASDLESDIGMSDYDTDESPTVMRSPTNLLYSLERLPAEAKTTVRDTLREPPLIALEHCRRINETYAFQMKELVTRSIRIRAPGSDGPHLSCSCRATIRHNDGGVEDDVDAAVADPLCPHLIWLLDQLVKETLSDHGGERPLTMMPTGYAEEMGDPFSAIASYHLAVLAPALHCPFIDPDTDCEAAADPTRVLEARELLAPYYQTTTMAAPGDFRPDSFTRPDDGLMGSLDRAVFNALLEDSHFFHHLLDRARATDPVKDPFRKLAQRVDRVLRALDLYVASPSHGHEDSDDLLSLEAPSNVPWASRHIIASVAAIRAVIFSRRKGPLSHAAATSAASTLVHILESVVARNIDVPNIDSAKHHHHHDARPRHDQGTFSSHRGNRNLYLCLIGDRDQGFVVDVLGLVPAAASQFLYRLEAALERISIHGAPLSYVDKFRALLQRLRAPRLAAC